MTGVVNGNGTAKWQLWVSMAGVGLVVLASLIGLFVQLATMQGQLRGLDARMDGMSRRMDAAEVRISDHRSKIDHLDAATVEIETQFRASDQTRNMSHAADMRVQAMLWEKVYKQRYPTDNAYYPTIARTDPPAQ